ncbi:hypothetical protein EUU23_09420 [Sphingorhabdus sp. IMCC26285]|uniref:Uncharacterized protein n=1 Tax=Sphingorhabdus profundilacus TaxID=2509718 RepID=A0A6I4M720_9SPHN|nr:hypothetical protein [Sphingorhabdus profundilacus]MVZ97925.1 hypothetical protein [Sphingorhabdus profundilacus]
MTQLDDLERELRAAIVDERLRLTEALAQALHLPTPPAWLGALTDVDIAAPVISRPAEMLVLSGSITHPLLGTAAFICELSAAAKGLTPRVRWSMSEPLRLAELLERAGLGFAAAAGRLIDGVVARGIRLHDLADGEPSITVEVAGAFVTRLVGIEISFAFSSVAFAAQGMRAAQVRGTASLGGLALPLALTLDDPVRVSATLPNVTLVDLARALGLELPTLPPLPLLATPLEAIRIILEPAIRLSGRVPVSGIGALVFVAAEVDGRLVMAAGLETSPGFRFGNLLPPLAPLDQLQSVLRLGIPALLLATEDTAQLPYPTAEGDWRTLPAKAGASFQGELLLDGFGLEAVAALLNMDALPFHIPLAPELADLKIAASLPMRIQAVPGVLTVEGVEVALSVQPIRVAAVGHAELNLFGMSLPSLALGVEVSGTQESLFLRTDEPWSHPLGLPIDVVELGLQLSTPPPAYGFFGKILMRSQELAVAAKFVGQAPSMLVVEAPGDLTLSDLVAEFIGVDLIPDFFEPSFKDLAIYIVLNPLGETIAGRAYPSGIAISGAIEYLGLSAGLRLSAKVDRVVAEVGLIAPVRFGSLLELTGPGGVGTPSLALDTGANPQLILGARLSLMGLVQDIKGVAGSNGITISLKQEVGPVAIMLDSELGENRFRADGTASFQLRASIGPIRLFDGGPSLGEIHLDTGFDAVTAILATSDGVKVTVEGTFVVIGLHIALPKIAVDSDAFARIPEQVIRYILDHADDLFAELLQSAEKWLQAIADGVVRAVENVAQVLKEHFEQQAQAIARGLTDALHYTTEQAAAALKSIGETAENVAKALTDIGKSPEDVAKSLITVGYPVQAVVDGLKAIGISGDVAEGLLRVANVPAEIAKKVIDEVFKIIPDVGVPFINIPHVGVPFIRIPHTRLPQHIRVPHIRF